VESDDEFENGSLNENESPNSAPSEKASKEHKKRPIVDRDFIPGLDEDSDDNGVSDDEGVMSKNGFKNAINTSNIYRDFGTDHEFSAGQIAEVYVRDFMNHKAFTLEFGKKLNFVSGANGAGKSAIVAAIQLCLGVGAKKTGRGDNNAALIRQGATGSAILTVKLRNLGADAWKPELMGDMITVEKTINRSGSASMRLFGSKSNSTVYTSKLELQDMLRCFNIYCDNPCNVLTQEESKKFIQGAEKDKYSFFLKATGLERTRVEIGETGEVITATQEKLESTKDSVERKAGVAKMLERDLAQLDKVEGLEKSIKENEAKKFWVKLRDTELVVESARGILDETRGKKAELEKELDMLRRAHAGMEQESMGDERVVLLEERLGSHRTAYQAALDKERLAKAAERERQDEVRNMNNQAGVYQKQLRECKAQLKQERDKAKSNAGNQESLLFTALEQCEADISSVRERVELTETHANNLQESIDRLEREDRLAGVQLAQRVKESNAVEQQIKHIRSSSGDRTMAYGREISKLVQEIRKNKFAAPVVGPLGMDIKLKDGCSKKWGLAIEMALKPVLNAFVVSTMEDQRKLAALVRLCGASSFVRLIKFQPRPRYKVHNMPADALSLLRCLEFTSDTAFNISVDFAKADSTIFVEKPGEEQPYIGQMSRAILPNGDQIRYKGHNNRTTSSCRDQYRRLLSEDMQEALAALTAQLQEMKADRQAAQNAKESTQGELVQGRKQMNEAKAEFKECQDKLRKLQRKKSEVDARLDEFRNIEQVDTTALENEERELEDTIQDCRAEVMQLKEEMSEQTRLVTEAAQERKVAKQAESLVEDELKRVAMEMENYSKALKTKEREISRSQEKIEAVQASCERKEKKIEEAEGDLAEQLEKTRAETIERIPGWVGDKMHIGRKETEDSLHRAIKTAQASIDNHKAKVGLSGRSRAAVAKQYERAKNDHDKHLRVYNEIEGRLKCLKEDLERRKKEWKNQRKSNVQIVKRAFDVYLNKKGCSGSLRFDHKEKMLFIKTQMDNEDEGTKVKDVRQLSGGERSYTTLCLLMALGMAIECPFRLMDEYDVFMDQVTRKLTLKELQRYSLDPIQKGRQFIVITPQELKDVVVNNDTRVFRIAAPKRSKTASQSAHGLQQTTLD
jgi:chromosome segregation ATPase